MLQIANKKLFQKIVEEAKAKAAANPGSRTAENWEKAIDRAASEIEKNGFRFFYNEVGDCLYLVSGTSGNFYTVNGSCRVSEGECCPSYLGRHVCWHRLAKKLWKNYLSEMRKMQTGDGDEVIASEFVTREETGTALGERCGSEVKNADHSIRKVFRTDSRGREYYVEMVGSILVSKRFYTGN